MSKSISLLLSLFLVLTMQPVVVDTAEAGLFSSAKRTRAKIDRVADETLQQLLSESDKAKRLYNTAVSYAVFDVTKVSLGVTGGGGTGVAVDKANGQRVYMHMGTGGLNLGIGGQVFRVVFLFEDRDTFKNFVEKGWEASASANAVAGRAGANAGASFTNGMAVYQVTAAGLMLQADISGTKYWRSKKLNK